MSDETVFYLKLQSHDNSIRNDQIGKVILPDNECFEYLLIIMIVQVSEKLAGITIGNTLVVFHLT